MNLILNLMLNQYSRSIALQKMDCIEQRFICMPIFRQPSPSRAYLHPKSTSSQHQVTCPSHHTHVVNRHVQPSLFHHGSSCSPMSPAGYMRAPGGGPPIPVAIILPGLGEPPKERFKTGGDSENEYWCGPGGTIARCEKRKPSSRPDPLGAGAAGGGAYGRMNLGKGH